MTEFGQAARVTAGAARRVQGCTGRDGVQDGPDDGLLEMDEGTAGVVVGLRPVGVAAGNVHDRYISTQLVDGLAAAGDTPDLGKPCRRLRVVVEQMTHERDPLDSEQELAKTQMPGHPAREIRIHGSGGALIPEGWQVAAAGGQTAWITDAGAIAFFDQPLYPGETTKAGPLWPSGNFAALKDKCSCSPPFTTEIARALGERYQPA
jgi:hypothetical protein